MDDIFEENDLMKRCSDCGFFKIKIFFYFILKFYFKNINQKLKKECAQCTKMKQEVYHCENREKFKNFKK